MIHLSTVMARIVRTEVWDTVSSMKGTKRHMAFPITQISWKTGKTLFLKKFLSPHPSHVHLDHGVGAAHDQNKQVSNAQVQQEQVGGGPHGLRGEDDDEDENIADNSNSKDQAGETE